MYYYHLRLALVTLASPDTSIHLFDDDLPAVLPNAVRYLKKTSPTDSHRHYHHPRHHQSKSRSKQTIATSTRPANAPPTPIRSPKQAHSLRLTDRADFRLGPVVVRTSITDTTQCGYGILRLFRDAASSHETGKESNKETSGPFYMSILAVPSYMAPAELLSFVGYKENSGCVYRMIGDHSPNKYTAIFRFDTAEAADQLITKYNGKKLRVTEPEICHVVRLRTEPAVDWMVIPSTKSPVSLHDTLQHDPEFDDTQCYELPLCPVCLERMDVSVTGLKKIVCEHTFDCSCLSKWGESDCPVCKYSQKPVLEPSRATSSGSGCGNGSGSSSSSSSSVSLENRVIKAPSAEHDYHECFECGATDSLWICMVCAHIGCGRYQDAHAYDHYCETGHLYVLEIETQHIWDYAGDGYVHCLIQNMVDGSLLELPSVTDAIAGAGSSDRSGGENEDGHRRKGEKGSAEAEEKMDTMSVEYTYLLTSQLDSQRIYYEDQLEQIYHAIANLTTEAKTLMMELGTIRSERETLTRTGSELDKRVTEVSREMAKMERRLTTWKAKAQAVEMEWKEEKEMTESLLANQKVLRNEAEEKDKTIQALNEQVMQLMAQLEGTEPPHQTEPAPPDDIINPAGEGSVPSPSPPVTKSKKKGKRGNRS